MSFRHAVYAGLGLLLLATVACNDTNEPALVDAAPTACLDLQVSTGLYWLDHGIIQVTFGVDPLCTGDDVTRRHNLEVRYDYEADGAWDTDWQDLGYVGCVQPDPLPADIWRVRMEVRDEAGNVSLAEAEQALPAEVPRQPDIGMTRLEFSSTIVSVDGVTELDQCVSTQVIWGWRLDEYSYVVCEMYVDDELVNQEEVLVARGVNMNCDRGTCFPAFYNDIADDLTPGIHEVTVIIDATDLVPEADESNNTRTVIIEIGEDGLPVIPAANP